MTMNTTCQGCLQGSQHVNISKMPIRSSKNKLDIVWTDVKGPLLDKAIYGPSLEGSTLIRLDSSLEQLSNMRGTLNCRSVSGIGHIRKRWRQRLMKYGTMTLRT